MSEDYAFGRGYAQSFTVGGNGGSVSVAGGGAGGNAYLGTPLPKLPAGAVKKKTLEFENLVVTYDYELLELTINQKESM